MKKFLLFFLLAVFAAATAAAQEKQTQDYKWGIGIQFYPPTKVAGMGPFQNDERILVPDPYDLLVSSTNYKNERKVKYYSVGLQINYSFKKYFSLQLRGGVTKRNITEHVYDSVPGNPNPKEYTRVEKDFDYKQTIVNFAPGVRWSYNQNRIGFYGGIELPFIFYGKGKQGYNVIDTPLDTITGKPSTIYPPATENQETVIPGGKSFGLGCFTGINLYILKKLSISPEFSFAYLYIQLGGIIKTEATYSEYITTHTEYIQSYTIRQFSFSQINPSITISYRF